MLVSIIITSYNYEKYIQECIDSCLDQKEFDNYEIIVVNDGSTDNTAKILSQYDSNSKIKIFNNTNSGIEAASNFGIKNALGKYVVRVDADDKLKNNFLKLSVDFLLNSKNAFAYSNYDTIDENSKTINKIKLPKFDKNEILNRGDFLATGTLYQKAVLEKINYYNEQTRNCGLENYELILNLLTNNYVGVHIDESLFEYRQHNTNISKTKREQIIKYGETLFEKFNLGAYKTNKFHPYGLVI